MAIPFETIPSNTLVPLFWAEVKPAQAPYNSSLKLLLIGRGLPGGFPAVVNTPYILSGARADELFGRGSMMSAMYRAARLQAPFAEIWGMIQGPAEDAEAATGSITVAADPSVSKSGTMSFYVGGRQYNVVVRSTETKATIATRMAAVINRDPWRYVNAAVDGTDATKVNLTVRWVGNSSNMVRIMIDRWGEVTLAARMLTFVAIQGGELDSSYSATLAALGDMAFDVIVLPYGASTIHGVATSFMDGESGRWSPYQQLYGHVVSATNNTFANLVSAGLLLNDPHLTTLGVTNSPQPQWEWGAALGALMVQHLAGPPEMSRPMQTLKLKGMMPSFNQADWHDITERQSLIEAGISTFTVDPDRTVRLNRVVTTRRNNVWGEPDPSWRDVNTLFQASYFVRAMRAAITGTFPRAALTDEDSGIPGFASPGQIRDVLIHEYKRLERLGLVENVKLFAEGLVVERDEVDANRVNVLMRPDVVNQLVVVAALVETHLQLTDAILT